MKFRSYLNGANDITWKELKKKKNRMKLKIIKNYEIFKNYKLSI